MLSGQVPLDTELLNELCSFHVLSLGSLVGQLKGYIQWWVGLQTRFPTQVQQKSSSKAGKALCFFNSNQQHPKFPDWKGPLALFCKLLALPTHLAAWVALGCKASRSCCQPFSSDGAVRHSVQGVGLCLSSLACVAPDYSQFPKQAKQLIWGSKSDRSAPHTGQSVAPSWFCRWAMLLVEITAWAL